MQEKTRYTLLTLIYCILVIGALVAAYDSMAEYAFQEIDEKTAALSVKAGSQVSDEVGFLLADLQNSLDRFKGYLPLALFGSAGLATLILWLIFGFLGRPARGGPVRAKTAAPSGTEKKKEVEKPSLEPAIQLLSMLQREGRFVDFLQEDLNLYDDAQIGAAVRNVHAGCRQVLKEHIGLSPIFKEEEGSQITVPEGFDAHEIRLMGNVTGNPPFQGALRHRGWKITNIDLPRRVEGREEKWIIAPAEVEVKKEIMEVS
jgi:hypothetical protein